MFIFLNGASDSLILFKFKNISRFLLFYFREMISYCLVLGQTKPEGLPKGRFGPTKPQGKVIVPIITQH